MLWYPDNYETGLKKKKKKKKNIFRDKTNFKTFATQRNFTRYTILHHPPPKIFHSRRTFQSNLSSFARIKIKNLGYRQYSQYFENCSCMREEREKDELKCRARSRARSRNEPSNFVSAIFVRFIARFRERKPTVSLGACSRWLTHNVTAPREKERADHACVIDSLANILHDTCTCTSRDATVGLLWSRDPRPRSASPLALP